MTAKEFLLQAVGLDQTIEAKLEQLSYLREHLTIRSPILKPDKVKGGVRTNRTEDLICDLYDLEADINNDIDELYSVKKDIENAIKGLADPKHRLVLMLKYLNFKTDEEIAQFMNYSIRSIQRFHEKALEQIVFETPTVHTNEC